MTEIDKRLLVSGICSIVCIDFLIVLSFLNPNGIGELIGTIIGVNLLAGIWVIGIINTNRFPSKKNVNTDDCYRCMHRFACDSFDDAVVRERHPVPCKNYEEEEETK